MVYEYKNKIYLDVNDLNDAIAEEVGKNMNNRDPYASHEFEQEWEDVEVLNANAWETFNAWRKQEGIKDTNGNAVIEYYNKIKEGEAIWLNYTITI